MTPFYLLFLVPLLVHGVPCNETYHISTYGQSLAQFKLLNISLLDTYLFPALRTALDAINSSPKWKAEVLALAEYVLPYSFIILLFGPILFFLFVLWISLEACFKCSSSPLKQYWTWSLLFARVCLVIGSFGIAMIAGFGIFSVSVFHGELLGPFISVTQLAREDGFRTESLWQTVQAMANKISLSIPNQTQSMISTYVSQIQKGTAQMDEFLATGHAISKYTNFLLSVAFGIVVFLCVLSIISAFMKRTKYFPWGITIGILLSILLLMPIVAVSGSLSIGISRECNQGIDNLVSRMLDPSQIGSCTTQITNYYLHCTPWVSTEDCNNPFTQATEFANKVLAAIQFLPGSSDDVITIKKAIQQFYELESCNETYALYREVKSSFCWDINNQSIWISLIILMQPPFLAMLLFYALFSWHAFGNGFDAVHFKTKNQYLQVPHKVMSEDEPSLESVELDTVEETTITTTLSFGDDDDDDPIIIKDDTTTFLLNDDALQIQGQPKKKKVVEKKLKNGYFFPELLPENQESTKVKVARNCSHIWSLCVASPFPFSIGILFLVVTMIIMITLWVISSKFLMDETCI